MVTLHLLILYICVIVMALGFWHEITKNIDRIEELHKENEELRQEVKRIREYK